jgi:predicted nuclease of predicted toxin-antitoxin system
VKFLIDNQLPPALAKWLISHGHEALHVLDVGLAEAKDEKIWEYAAANSLALITKNEDFSRRAAKQSAEVSVVRVRLAIAELSPLWTAFDAILRAAIAALETAHA